MAPDVRTHAFGSRASPITSAIIRIHTGHWSQLQACAAVRSTSTPAMLRSHRAQPSASHAKPGRPLRFGLVRAAQCVGRQSSASRRIRLLLRPLTTLPLDVLQATGSGALL